MANNNHFNLTLDTLAPEGSISRDAHAFTNVNFDLTIVKGDASFMKVWYNTNASGSKEDAGYTGGNWIDAATSHTTAFDANGTYYYHLVLMDDVNNESIVYNTESIVYDTTKPVASNAYMEDPDSRSRTITNNKTGVKYGFEFVEEGGSGVQKAEIYGDDIDTITVNSPSSPYSSTLDFKAGVEDGTKVIKVKVYDNAGNVSDEISASITLDTKLDAPVLSLLKNQETEELLPSYINYHGIKIKLASNETDVVAYKIWEGATEPDAWVTPVSPATTITFPVKLDHTLSANDGVKTIHAKIKDSAGTVVSAEDKSVTIDTVKPVLSISSDRSIISNVADYNKAVLTLSGSDASSGIKSWDLTLDGTSIKGSLTDIPASFDLTSSYFGAKADGTYAVVLTATDNAENTDSKSVNIIWDTTSPEVTINTLNTWYNAEFGVTVGHTDANAMVSMYVWSNTSATDTVVPSGTTAVTPSGTSTDVASSSIKWNLAQSDSNYIHVKVIDEVGNDGYAHAKFGFDNVAPTKPTIVFSQSAYASTSASVTISSTDSTSGLYKMRVEGDITNGTGADAWEDYASTKSVTLTGGDGLKHVTVIVKDKAENVSVISDQAETELDTSKPAAILTIYEADGTTAKPSYSPVETLSAHVGCTDDTLGQVQYKLYGDFTYESQQAQGITEEAAEWKDLILESGKDYMLVGNMFCTSGDGTKTVYLKVKDNAGNVSDAVNAFFVYDTAAPSVAVSNVDYNRISKVYVLRRNSSGTIEGKYSDETHFTFTPDSAIKAYKVCAYLDATAARKDYPASGTQSEKNTWVEAQLVIPQSGDTISGLTPKSINMHATGLNSSAAVNAMIGGADYEYAVQRGVADFSASKSYVVGDYVKYDSKYYRCIKAHEAGEFKAENFREDVDGAHIVVVYVQDLAGSWSVAAEFTA